MGLREREGDPDLQLFQAAAAALLPSHTAPAHRTSVGKSLTSPHPNNIGHTMGNVLFGGNS